MQKHRQQMGTDFTGCLRHCVVLAGLLIAATTTPQKTTAQTPGTEKAEQLMAEAQKRITPILVRKQLMLGAPVFIRIFKIPATLELWLQGEDAFELFQSYPLCRYSGFPGPKLQEGDWQSPEGFYTVTGQQLNPNSNYHLSFNIGYPNMFDRSRLRTGSMIMIHGGCMSMGCYALGNKAIEEVYLLVHSALAGNQAEIDVHVFPFQLTPENMKKYKHSPWWSFWRMLEPGYKFFEKTGQVPEIAVQNGQYIVNGNRQKLAKNEFTNRIIQ